VSSWQILVVFVAGLGAGTINTVVGSGTLITFPVLLAVGLAPVTANVSNTVGLFPGSFTGAYGYRRELEGQGSRAIVLASASVPGAIVGAVLLLVLPPGVFKTVVPVLIGLAVIVVAFGQPIAAWTEAHGRGATDQVTVVLWLATFATAIYGGYFGAAQGVLLMGSFAVFLVESLQRQNALKNVLAGLVNFVAAIVFILTTHVDWTAAVTIACGSIVGAVLGARVGRRLSPSALRATIIVVGLIAMGKLLA
jgi:uncharacterized membrane protein YfcA